MPLRGRESLVVALGLGMTWNALERWPYGLANRIWEVNGQVFSGYTNRHPAAISSHLRMLP